MITSTRNPKVQWIRSLQAHSRARREAGVFVAEGVRLLEEAQEAGWQPELVLFTADLSERGREIVSAFSVRGAPVEEVTPAVLKAASDTETPQGVLAVLQVISCPLPKRASFVLIPDEVRDPGNLGTILRTADAAGVDAVLLPPRTADVYSPKVVRSGMGAHFHLAVHAMPWDAIQVYLAAQPAGFQIYLADIQAGQPYTQTDMAGPLALVIGGEAFGAGDASRQFATRRLHIPMPGKAESLNAAVAAAILMFEVVRQRAGSRSE